VVTSGGAPDGLVLHLRLDHDPRAGGVARAAVRELLDGQRTSNEVRQDAALVVYELINNAVTHGAPEADGRISFSCEVVEETLVVIVSDGGSGGRVAVGDLDQEAAHGRGLAIVEALSTSWSVDRTEGTIVRAILPLG